MQLDGIACSSCLHKDCDGSKGWSIFQDDDTGEVTRGCPLLLVTEHSAMLCEQWPHYDKGYLPVAGGILDQTAVYVQGMTIIQSELNKYQEKEAEKHRRRGGK